MSKNPQQDTLQSELLFEKSNISPLKKGAFDENQDPLFLGAYESSNGASLFTK